MSCYDDIYNDFPLRCATVWETFNKDAKDQKVDVTLMLMCAAAGFSTPWEHLKIQEGQAKANSDHPAFFNYDERKYASGLKTMEKALKGCVTESPLFRHVKLDQCFYGRATTIGLIRDMAESRQPSNLSLSTQGTRNIVKALRNAIAHNNIYAFARLQPKEISDLTFFSQVLVSTGTKDKGIDCYEVIVMSVEDFRSFLTAWFALLRTTNSSGKYLKLVVSNALETDNEPIAAFG